ncbi:MAG: proton-conducting transporter membrane subunit [Chloroflexota bacterium]|nr:proton-conducting transporter membrane subunit [Chloroflexota bacterium]
MIAGPLFLIGFPLAMVPIVYLLRRWETVAALLSAATTAIVAWVCIRLPLDRPAWMWGHVIDLSRTVQVLGRELALLRTGRLTIAFVFGVATILFLFARWISQGRSFFPLGLLILSLLNGVILIQHPLFSVLLLAMAALVAVFIIQGGRLGSTRGAIRYLTSTVLGFPFLLGSVWLIDQYALNPDDLSLAHLATLLLALGFAILLGAVPFHGWVPAVAAEAPSLVAAFIFTVVNAVVLFEIFDFLGGYPWLAESPRFFWVLRMAGLAMVVWGGLCASFQRDFGHLFGYAALNDMGWVLASLGMTSPLGLTVALWQLACRTVAVVMGAMGLAVVRHHAQGDAFAQLGGVARRLPFSVAGLILGGLSLVGLPFTIGFPSRWVALDLMAGHLPAKPGIGWALLLLASGGVAMGYLRGLYALLGPSADADIEPELISTSIMISFAIALCLALGLRPQPLLRYIRGIAENLRFFPP